jgi:hypothetical protein
MLSLMPCPDPACGAPAKVRDRAVLASTDGSVAHVVVQCARWHVFFKPATRPGRASLQL